MALPSLDNKTTIGQLSLDDKASIITSLVQSGKLGLSNYGAINFNQNVTVQGTATKEGSGSIGSDLTAGFNELKNSILGLTANISEFFNKFVQDKQVSENFMEAVARDVKSKGEEREASGEAGILRLQKPFESVAEGLTGVNKTLKDMAEKGGFGGGEGFLSKLKDMFSGFGLGGMMGKLFSALGGVLGLMGKSIPILAAGYVLTKLPWGSMAEEGKKLISEGGDLVGSIKNIFSETFSEPGENQDVGDSTAPTSTGTSTAAPSGGTAPTSTGTSTAAPSGGTAPTSKPTAERSRFDSTTSGDIASESDLVGLSFTSHAHKGLPLKVEKQIKKALAQRLQYIRKKLGGTQLNITSGYRPDWYNKKIKGAAKDSQHRYGNAADVVKSGFNQKSFVKAAVESGIGAIGFYDSFIHIDIRPRGKGGRIARWGKIPDWALEFINNPNRYTMGDSAVAESTKTSGHEETEPDENRENTASEQTKTGTDVASKTTPTSGTPSTKDKETATPETGTTAAPEEEDEREETSEKVLTDPSLSSTKKTTAVKELVQQGNGSAQEAMRFFEKYWTKEQAAGIVGNLQHESDNTFDPKQKQKGGGPGYGIAQWEKPRQQIFKNVMKKDIKNSSFLDQLNFVQWELTHGTYKKAGNELKKTKTVKDATLAVRAYYEVPGKNNDPNKPHSSDKQRIQYAENVFGNPDKTEDTRFTENQEGGQGTKLNQESSVNPEPATTEPTTADATTPTQTIGDKIANSFQSTIESIKNIKDFKESDVSEGIGKVMAEVGSALGFDPSRLNLPKTEAIAEQTANSSDNLSNITSKLEMKQTEEAKALTTAKNELDQAKEIKNKKAEESSKPQQPVVINNSTTTNGGQNSSVINPGAPNALETRDSTPAIQGLTHGGLKSGVV